jgi:hypothetical protein
MKIGITERGDAGLDLSWKERMGEVDGAILITKAPHLLLPHLKREDRVIVHCTITGFGGTPLEPGVASPEITIPAAHALVDLLGGERVVLRIDPIIPTSKGMERACYVLDRAWWGRIRVSFLDLYPHAIQRFKARGLPIPWDGFHAPLATRREAMEELNNIYAGIEICGEPGFECSGCLSQRDLAALGIEEQGSGKSYQRRTCACLGVKTVLLAHRHPCAHNCAYCFWKD